MPHYCEAALVTCDDFRLHQRKDGRNYIAEFIKSLGVDCDLITRAGAVQDLLRSNGWIFSRTIRFFKRMILFRDLRVSVDLHKVKTIYLVNHEDCGAYGDIKFSSREEELAFHYDDLKAAKEIITAKFPNTEIKLYFGELESGASDSFIIKEIN